MERMQSMFSNAYNTPAGHLVEKATAGHLATEDWALNMELCDAINSYGDGARDAVKAIKRRLSGNKNFNQIALTLSVIESCIKNCGSKFRILVTSREFSKDTLLKVIQPKNNPPIVLQEKVLGMIKQLADTFGSNPQMSGVAHVYQELKSEGVEFPKTQALGSSMTEAPSHSSRSRTHPQQQPQQQHNAAYITAPTQSQISKLKKDISVVVGNIKVFSEMLTELNPSNCDAPDVQLMQDLNRTCRAMQKRVVELLEQVGNEEITIELLKINDDLNNVFLRYDRFERFRANKKSAQPETQHAMPAAAAAYPSAGPSSYRPELAANTASLPVPVEEPPPSYSDTEQPTPEVSDLIDLSADNSQPKMPAAQGMALPQELAGLSLNPSYQPSSSNGVNSDLTLSNQLDAYAPEPEVLQLGSSVDEIEQWLSANGSQLGVEATQPPSGETTDEFNAFLGERVSQSSHGHTAT